MNKFKTIIILTMVLNTTIHAQNTVTTTSKGLVDLVGKLSEKINELEKQINQIELKNKNILPAGSFPNDTDLVTLPSFGLISCTDGSQNSAIYILGGGNNTVAILAKSDSKPYVRPTHNDGRYVIRNYYSQGNGNGHCEILTGDVKESDIKILINTNN